MTAKRSGGVRSAVRAKRKTPTTTARKSATRTSKTKAAPVPLPHELVARRAYEIWQEAVRHVGQPAKHWAQAEAQLRAELKKSARARRPTRAAKVAALQTSTPVSTTLPETGTRLAA